MPAYQESIQGFNETARETLGEIQVVDDKLAYVNPFAYVHLLNSGALPKDVTRLAKRYDLEKARIYDPKFAKRNSVKFGIALKNPGDYPRNSDPNYFLARKLAEQLKTRGIPLAREIYNSGNLIDFNDLALEESTESDYGLIFKLKDSFEGSSVRELSEFEWDDELNSGIRIAFACFDWPNRWNCFDDFLYASDSDDRVVVVSGEATQKI